jgi:PPOX class probable F420-dependent enzyme
LRKVLGANRFLASLGMTMEEDEPCYNPRGERRCHMPRRLSKAERERFLDGRHVAVLVTLGPDGEPVPTPIWFLYRDGRFYFRTEVNAIKAKNIQRDPRVSICVQEERPPYKAVIVHGKAQLEKSPEWLAASIPRHYLGFVGAMGYERAARTAIESGPEIAIIVQPERYVTFDFAPETPLVGRLWLQAKRVLPPWV